MAIVMEYEKAEAALRDSIEAHERMMVSDALPGRPYICFGQLLGVPLSRLICWAAAPHFQRSQRSWFIICCLSFIESLKTFISSVLQFRIFSPSYCEKLAEPARDYVNLAY
jgi:hypothetical protein